MEVMAAVFMLGVLLLPLLTIRERATGRVERAHSRFRAIVHAENILTQHLRDPQEVLQGGGEVEDDPYFRYELTIEDWDASTSLPEVDEEDDESSLFDEITPGDAGVPPEDEDEVLFSLHEVRRFEVEVFWPHHEKADQEESLRLEGFIPRVPDDRGAVFRNR